MSKIEKIMEKDAYTCHENATVSDVIKTLSEMEIGGVPIVDDEKKLKGYITNTDIIKFIRHQRATLFDWGGELTPALIDKESFKEKSRELLAMPVMKVADRKKIFVEADDTIEEVADIFKKESIKKIAVLKKGKVVGIVTRSIILRYYLEKML
jgi:DHA2 family lincomycin resistance protein-like MFS transporter